MNKFINSKERNYCYIKVLDKPKRVKTECLMYWKLVRKMTAKGQTKSQFS